MVWVEEYNEKKRSRYEITKDYGHLCPFVPGFRETLQTHFRLKLGFCPSRLDTPGPLPPRKLEIFTGNFRQKGVQYAIQTVIYRSWNLVNPLPPP